jgi:hypothetical protein
MSDTWFEGVGLAESPFAEAESAVTDEVEAPTEAWPSESVGLPPSWPEEEEDGARGELPFATEAWTPWAPAEAWPLEAEAPGFGQAMEESPSAAAATARAGAGLARQNTLPVERMPLLLAGHRGRAPDLILRWNVASVPEAIDVVVHLHGNSRPRLRLDRDVLPYSGLDLAPVGEATGPGRSRPTLAILPRGHDTGTKQASPPYFNRYTFPALIAANGLGELVRFALERLAAELGSRPPRVGRLILTAHSAGGKALLELLRHHDPQQVHVFDALYQSPAALVTWALRHIRQDRAALAGLDAATASQYMAARGGALRVFYQGRVTDGTRTWSNKVRDAIAAELDPALARWYRVEASKHDHFQIPRRYGGRVLADAAADVPDTYAEPVTHQEAEHWEAVFELAQAEEPEAPWAATEQEAFEGEAFEGEFQKETEGEVEGEEEGEGEPEAGEREGLLTHASEEALARLEPLAAEAEALGPDEEGPPGRSWTKGLLEQSVLVAAIAAGQRSESVLTDRLFRLRHPEYKDKPIAKGDEAARSEWRQIRDRQVVPMLLTGPFVGPMHDLLATTPAGTDLRKSLPEGAVLSPLSITRRGLRKAPTGQPGTIAAIVVHNTSRGPANKSREGGYRRPAIEYALDHYLNGKEGFPHYVVDFNGTIYATCDERLVAWHAGWVHVGGVKLFRSGWTAPDWWSRVWSRHGAATPIDLLPKGARSPNYRTIGIELLLLPDMSYTPQQYKALARLVVDIQQRNPDLQIQQAPSRALLGHEDFAPVTAEGGRADPHGGWDPGAHRDRPFFDWQRLWSEIQALGGKGTEAPESLEAEAEAEGRKEAEEEAGEELEDQPEVTTAQELAEPELSELEAFRGELLDGQDGPTTVTLSSGQTPPVAMKDTPIDVVEAIVHMMSWRGLAADVGPKGEPVSNPRYAPEVAKTVLEPDHKTLLWVWYLIALGDDFTHGDRAKIADAHAKTAPLIARMKADKATTKKAAALAARYAAGLEELSQRAAREQVNEMIEAGVAAVLQNRPGKGFASEDDQLRVVVDKARTVLTDVTTLTRRVFSAETTGKLTKTEQGLKAAYYDKQLTASLQKFLKEGEFGDAPKYVAIQRASGMNFADGVHLLKGGLDGVSAILAVTDPKAREALFRERSNYWGSLAQGAEINKVLWKFVGGVIAFGGAGVYGVAKILGNTALAEDVLDATVKGVANVGAALNLAGFVHGVAVLIDPDATANQKAEAAVEVASSAIGLASFASRLVPRLAWASKWSGPISVSLTVNLFLLKQGANIVYKSKVSGKRVDWVPCYKAVNGVAVEVQKLQRLLAVTSAILATETDPRRKVELTSIAAGLRYMLIEQQLKPFVAQRLSSTSMDEDPDSCGYALSKRFKPMQAMLGSAAASNESALTAGATFLLTVKTAFDEWDQIVMEKEPAAAKR